jgi:hypothetical protein
MIAHTTPTGKGIIGYKERRLLILALDLGLVEAHALAARLGELCQGHDRMSEKMSSCLVL